MAKPLDPKVAIPILQGVNATLEALCNEKHGELTDDILKPLEQAIRAIREATAAILLATPDESLAGLISTLEAQTVPGGTVPPFAPATLGPNQVFISRYPTPEDLIEKPEKRRP
jgi:hypothetical protein